MQETINQFVDKLVEEKDLPAVDSETMAQIKTDLRERLENILNATIVEKLPAEKLPEFEAILDKQESADEMQKFCVENIPNLEQVLANALLDFRRIYLNL